MESNMNKARETVSTFDGKDIQVTVRMESLPKSPLIYNLYVELYDKTYRMNYKRETTGVCDPASNDIIHNTLSFKNLKCAKRCKVTVETKMDSFEISSVYISLDK